MGTGINAMLKFSLSWWRRLIRLDCFSTKSLSAELLWPTEVLKVFVLFRLWTNHTREQVPEAHLDRNCEMLFERAFELPNQDVHMPKVPGFENISFRSVPFNIAQSTRYVMGGTSPMHAFVLLLSRILKGGDGGKLYVSMQRPWITLKPGQAVHWVSI
jgi:hypothetical protein